MPATLIGDYNLNSNLIENGLKNNFERGKSQSPLLAPSLATVTQFEKGAEFSKEGNSPFPPLK